jgi:23S rRNA (uracil1939-C5)-methyltransferase
MKKQSHTQQIITIEKLVPLGKGLGRQADGMIIMVPGVIPGEEVRVSPENFFPSYIEARAVEIITPSPLRVEAQCPIYKKCGGCCLQHISARAQADLKNEILKEHLQRNSILADSDTSVITNPLPSPQAWNYRQRIRLQVDKDGQVGFYQNKSNSIVPVQKCLLASSEINLALEQISGNESYGHLLKFCQAIELFHNPVNNLVIMMLHLLRLPRPADLKAAKRLMEIEMIEEILFKVNGKGVLNSRGDFTTRRSLRFMIPSAADTSLPVTFAMEPGGFCQVNLLQNQNMIKILDSWLSPKKDQNLLDLFSGMGNLSLPLAAKVKHVLGIELKRASIRSAINNCQEAKISNCDFRQQDVTEAVKELSEQGETFDLIILDPPRQGAEKICHLLHQFKAEKIVYISCDPATLTRDLQILLNPDNGYHLEKIKMLDMFPQTAHLETMALLTR